MDISWKSLLWCQFGAAIAMLENAIQACPDELWDQTHDAHSFWYLAYHTLFFLDYYSSGTEVGFAPPTPFTLSELDPSGPLPERVYSKQELLAYLQHGRARCMSAIDTLTDECIGQHCGFKRFDLTVAEMFMNNMRHVQHHAAQLNLLMRQSGNDVPGWVSTVKS